MRIIKYQQKTFELPPPGLHRGRLVEIKDVSPAMNPQGEEKDRVRFVWTLLHQLDSSGNPMKVFQTLNLSLHPRSFLSQTIGDITGQEPGEEFDLDSLLGSEADLLIKHNSGSDGRTYANVVSILRPPTPAEAAEAQRVAAVTAKVKEMARQPAHIVSTPPPAAPALPNADSEITDADIPF